SDLQSTNVASLRQVGLSDGDLRVIRIERAEQANASLDAAALRSFGGRIDVTTSLILSEGNSTEVKTISLGPASFADDAEATASDSSASLSARLVGEDVFAGRIVTGVPDSFNADDNRFFVGRLPADESVLIVQPLAAARGHARFVEKALQASLYNITDVNPARVTDRLPGDTRSLRPYSAVICPARVIDKGNLNAVREYAREGGLLVLMLGPEEGDLPAELLDGASIKPLDETQTTGLLPPVGAAVTPDVEPGLSASYASVRFRAARSVSARDDDIVLRYTDGEPAAARVSFGKGSFVLLGFGLSEKDTSLVRSPLFPDFIEWLIEGAGRSASVAQFIAGETPAAILGGGARKLTRIYSADGGARFEEVTLDLQTLDEPGVYRVERDGGEVVFAINTPASESRLAQASEQDFVDRIIPASAGRSSSEERHTPAAEQAIGLWWLVAVAALALSLMELVYCSIDPKAEGN
ncbi:MAG TPA: hypothetical protein VFQ92_23905, partial [Blastocatellia bacterium]|nr:hypothetical protein [Blastocatellia bacterium]